MKTPDSLLRIKNSLRSIEKNTGSRCFEGLMVTLLEAATGRSFRLSASGQQHGHDASSESGTGIRIKSEAKHYRQATLKLRELVAEIEQATSSDPNLDLWVLVASGQVKVQHEDELTKRLRTSIASRS